MVTAVRMYQRNIPLRVFYGRLHLLDMMFENISDEMYVSNEENNEITNILIDCCNKLQPQQRAVFNLRDLEGLTFEEISEILETPIVNIRSNLYLARKNVRQILYDVYEIDRGYFNEM